MAKKKTEPKHVKDEHGKLWEYRLYSLPELDKMSERDRKAVRQLMFDGELPSPYGKEWIIRVGVPIVESYGGNVTVRALHYRLVSKGMFNNMRHYKKVCSSMEDARWDGLLGFDSFRDHERETIGDTRAEETTIDEEVENSKRLIKHIATRYNKNRWENQPYYPEVFIEKKALQGVFEGPCEELQLALNPCKGYPSLTYLNDAAERFKWAVQNGKAPIILYFGDYDCSGEDIPRSIQDNLERMGVEVKMQRVTLTEDQVVKWKLPFAPTKEKDSRGKNWDGLGQVELDAVEPEKIEQLLRNAVDEIFDEDLYEELKEKQDEERAEFKRILKRDFKKLLD